MPDQWYLYRQGTRHGPYTWAQLCEFARQGSVAPEDLVWKQGMADWVQATEVQGLLPRTATPAAPPPAPAVGAVGQERVVGIIPSVHRKAGLLSQKTYNLVVTDRRIVFAEVTSQMLTQAAADAARESKEQGKGFLARAADTFRSFQRVYDRYWEMTPEAILAENPGNSAVGFGEISSVRFHIETGANRRVLVNQGMSQQRPDRLDIKTSRETMKLTFAQNMTGQSGATEARDLLRQVLGEAVR